MLILMLRMKVPGNKSSWGRMFQGMKVPPVELLFPGTKVLRYESSSYLLRVCRKCYRPCTLQHARSLSIEVAENFSSYVWLTLIARGTDKTQRTANLVALLVFSKTWFVSSIWPLFCSRWQVMLATAVHRQALSASSWPDNWRGIRCTYGQHWWQADQAADLGHSQFNPLIIFLFRCAFSKIFKAYFISRSSSIVL